METYISILRGINVGGHNKIPMTGLKDLYEELNLKNIITYIQSGNVIFKFAKVPSEQGLAKKIEKKILEKYGFDVPVIIRSLNEIENTLVTNPFLKQDGIDIEKLHVTFLSDVPQKAQLEAIKKYYHSPEKFIILGKEVYVYCPNGYGNTKISNTFFENKLKVTATTRNWKTVNKLADLAKE